MIAPTIKQHLSWAAIFLLSISQKYRLIPHLLFIVATIIYLLERVYAHKIAPSISGFGGDKFDSAMLALIHLCHSVVDFGFPLGLVYIPMKKFYIVEPLRDLEFFLPILGSVFLLVCAINLLIDDVNFRPDRHMWRPSVALSRGWSDAPEP